jgi:hypothetical protein
MAERKNGLNRGKVTLTKAALGTLFLCLNEKSGTMAGQNDKAKKKDLSENT